MLDLSDEQRRELMHRGALTSNADGHEVLVGLTLAESRFYIAYGRVEQSDPASDETTLYYQLKHKHLSARIGTLLKSESK